MNCFIESDNKIALLATAVELQMIRSALLRRSCFGIHFYQAWKNNNTSLLFVFPSLPIGFFYLGWGALLLCPFALQILLSLPWSFGSDFSPSALQISPPFLLSTASGFSTSANQLSFPLLGSCASDFYPFAHQFSPPLLGISSSESLRSRSSVFSPFAVDFWLFVMKNVYRKGKVHPQTFPDPYSVLRLLPVAVATLSVALPAEDQEVLAYLIARSPDVLPLKENKRNSLPLSSMAEKASQQSSWSHKPSFECSCFQCYTSFWSRWDASPNRQTIHEAIDLYEEHMAAAARADAAKGNSKGKNRKGFKDKNPSHSDESFTASASNEKPGVSVMQTLEAEDGFKEDLNLKKDVPTEAEEGLKEEEKCSGSPPRPPPLTIGGRGIMRRVFPNITSFIADHLWTAWTSPTGPEQQL